jgi:hypothetical protein
LFNRWSSGYFIQWRFGWWLGNISTPWYIAFQMFQWCFIKWRFGWKLVNISTPWYIKHTFCLLSGQKQILMPQDYLTTRTSLSPIRRGFVPGFVNYKKGCTRLAAASDKVYQLLAHGRWFLILMELLTITV